MGRHEGAGKQDRGTDARATTDDEEDGLSAQHSAAPLATLGKRGALEEQRFC